MKTVVSVLVFNLMFFITQAQIKRTVVPSAKPDTGVSEIVSPVATPAKKNKRAAFKELNLSRQQMKQLKEMSKENKAKKSEIEANPNLDEAQKKSTLKKMRAEQLKKMQKLLTPEQIQKLKEIRKNKTEDNLMMDTEMDN